jgi:hypothetical protein
MPETHSNQQDQEREKALADFASWDAINLLRESVLFHDTSSLVQESLTVDSGVV